MALCEVAHRKPATCRVLEGFIRIIKKTENLKVALALQLNEIGVVNIMNGTARSRHGD